MGPRGAFCWVEHPIVSSVSVGSYISQVMVYSVIPEKEFAVALTFDEDGETLCSLSMYVEHSILGFYQQSRVFVYNPFLQDLCRFALLSGDVAAVNKTDLFIFEAASPSSYSVFSLPTPVLLSGALDINYDSIEDLIGLIEHNSSEPSEDKTFSVIWLGKPEFYVKEIYNLTVSGDTSVASIILTNGVLHSQQANSSRTLVPKPSILIHWEYPADTFHFILAQSLQISGDIEWHFIALPLAVKSTVAQFVDTDMDGLTESIVILDIETHTLLFFSEINPGEWSVYLQLKPPKPALLFVMAPLVTAANDPPSIFFTHHTTNHLFLARCPLCSQLECWPYMGNASRTTLLSGTIRGITALVVDDVNFDGYTDLIVAKGTTDLSQSPVLVWVEQGAFTYGNPMMFSVAALCGIIIGSVLPLFLVVYFQVKASPLKLYAIDEQAIALTSQGDGSGEHSSDEDSDSINEDDEDLAPATVPANNTNTASFAVVFHLIVLSALMIFSLLGFLGGTFAFSGSLEMAGYSALVIVPLDMLLLSSEVRMCFVSINKVALRAILLVASALPAPVIPLCVFLFVSVELQSLSNLQAILVFTVSMLMTLICLVIYASRVSYELFRIYKSRLQTIASKPKFSVSKASLKSVKRMPSSPCEKIGHVILWAWLIVSLATCSFGGGKDWLMWLCGGVIVGFPLCIILLDMVVIFLTRVSPFLTVLRLILGVSILTLVLTVSVGTGTVVVFSSLSDCIVSLPLWSVGFTSLLGSVTGTIFCTAHQIVSVKFELERLQ
ncbi:hypothetical protein Pelo_1378 [Pelomyxa schiedti]|nr:hypothetical protein Pelo_1378 [Pelomyxa schiedti]